MQRPLLRRGVLAWLDERFPQAEVEVVEDISQLLPALQLRRPRLLLTEAWVLSRVAIPPALLPRVLLLGPGPQVCMPPRPEHLAFCAQIGDGLDESTLCVALEQAIGCERPHAIHCASDACELRIRLQPATLGLSAREMEVFQRLGAGEAPREIAAALGLSVKTVEHYRAQIKDKLALRDSRELLEFAVLWLRGLASRPSQLRGQ
ncbi:helix-turn-helix transcriptional regulator [Aquimonas voraii]|uniref:helix-turn-helix transcriptional regulator n=1 Tax=Aquimonas voraii TaxID=265719 RepID=UPI00159FFAF4|nr:helix-turn-helix transcriptional regulator [Aquimonas voraii]